MRSLHQACQSMKHTAASTAVSRLRSSPHSAVLQGLHSPQFQSSYLFPLGFDSLNFFLSATEDAGADPGLPRKCPTSRTPGSGVLAGFLRIHASSKGVAGSASGCWDLSLSSMFVVLVASGLDSIGGFHAAWLLRKLLGHTRSHERLLWLLIVIGTATDATRDVHEAPLLSRGSGLVDLAL